MNGTTAPADNRARWNERYAGRELVWSAGPNARFAEDMAGLPPGTALDAACGEGRNALWLAEQGWRVTGIDFSDVAIEKARTIGERREAAASRPLRVDWRVDDVSALESDAAFDLVALLYLHTDSGERMRWLPRLAGAVAPGGTFYYLGHAQENIEQGIGGPQDPDLLPTADDIVEHLKNFRVDVAELVMRPVKGEPGHGAPTDGADTQALALDLLVRAVRLM